MAIHVRATNTVKLKIAALIKRILMIALGVSLFLILTSAAIMYIIKEYIKKEADQSFVTYVEPAKPDTQRKARKNKQEDTAAQESAQVEPPTPIVVAQTSDTLFDLPTQADDLGRGVGEDEGSALTGFGLAGLGDGLDGGDGLGLGAADDSDLTDPGAGGVDPGFNDDIQVVLILDASGSMEPLFQAASACMEDVMIALSHAEVNGKKAKVNVGIITYGQMAQNGAPIKISPFTTVVGKIRSQLAKVTCDGGNEPCGAAIAYAVENFEWNRRERGNMLKVIFIAGNEHFNQGNVDYRMAIKKAREQNIIVNTIRCNTNDDEWKAAAILGNGECLDMKFTTDEAAEENDPKEMLALLRALHNCKPLPVGPPEVQLKHIKMINSAPAPGKADNKSLHNWLRNNRQRIIIGYDWDAIEICRRTPPDQFSIESLGGIGNIPISLRGKSEAEILAFITAEAKKRDSLLEHYRIMEGNINLGDLLMNALQRQAQAKGITIKF